MSDLTRALDKMAWAAVGTVRHPTAECGIYRQGIITTANPNGTCTCGLWEAIKLVDASPIGRMLRDYHDDGVLPL